MPTPELCTDEEIEVMVHAFYADVRRDEVLGPIFNGHIDDWDEHLTTLVDFWSSVLRGTRRFSGTPMAKHTALADLRPELFQRWLALFQDTTSAQPNQAMGVRAQAVARRIAQSLWYGYQTHHDPHGRPRQLALDPSAGRSSHGPLAPTAAKPVSV